jgi:hypothetical protein
LAIGWTAKELRYGSGQWQETYVVHIIQWLTQRVLMVTSTVLKQLECEADHSPLSSAKFRNALGFAASPHGVVTEWFQQAPHRDENSHKSEWLYYICVL